MQLSKVQQDLANDVIQEIVDSSAFTGIVGRIGPSALSVDEGANLNFTVVTGNDATYYYWIEGVSGTINSSDFASGWADSASRGTFSVTNGTGTFSLTLASDQSTDGVETFRVKVSKNSSGAEFVQSAIVTINDTSLGPSQAQGENFGYTSGGSSGPPTFTVLNPIDKFPFASDTNASDVGDLFVSKYNHAGQSSSTHGYNSGGTTAPITQARNDIDKFPFVSGGNASDMADLFLGRREVCGQISVTHGYTSGGFGPPGTTSDVIDKFPFSSDTNASDVGNLYDDRSGTSGQSSTTHGYNCGSSSPQTSYFTTMIDKFPFSSDTNAADIGDLVVSHGDASGQNSNSHGYSSGGIFTASDPTGSYSAIQKFPFASDTNSVSTGQMSILRGSRAAGQSSDAHGYTSGGLSYSTMSNVIDKFSFTSDGDAADVGDLSVTRGYSAGQQY